MMASSSSTLKPEITQDPQYLNVHVEHFPEGYAGDYYEDYLENENATAMIKDAWRVEIYTYAIPFLLVLFGLSFAANIYVLISLRWLRKQLTLNLLFTISLTVADAWVSLAVALGLIVNSYLVVVHNTRLFGDEYSMCFGMIFEAVRVGAMITTIFHLLALTMYHYLGIVRPLHYLSLLTKQGAVAVIVVLWICPPFTLIVYFSVVPGQAFLSDRCENVYFFQTISFRMPIAATICGPLLVITLLYVHIVTIIIRTRRKRSEALGMFFGSTREQHRTELRKLKAVSTTSLVVGTYVVGWLPIVIAYVIFCEDCALRQKDYAILATWLSLIGHSLLSFKCLFDPLIYAIRISDVRNALRNMHAKWRGYPTPLPARSSFIGATSNYSGGGSPQHSPNGSHNLLHNLSLRLLHKTSSMDMNSPNHASPGGGSLKVCNGHGNNHRNAFYFGWFPSNNLKANTALNRSSENVNAPNNAESSSAKTNRHLLARQSLSACTDIPTRKSNYDLQQYCNARDSLSQNVNGVYCRQSYEGLEEPVFRASNLSRSPNCRHTYDARRSKPNRLDKNIIGHSRSFTTMLTVPKSSLTVELMKPNSSAEAIHVYKGKRSPSPGQNRIFVSSSVSSDPSSTTEEAINL